MKITITLTDKDDGTVGMVTTFDPKIKGDDIMTPAGLLAAGILEGIVKHSRMAAESGVEDDK